MRDWAAELLDCMQGVCELLDEGHAHRPYSTTLKEQRLKLEDVEQTPSARLLRELRNNEQCFSTMALRFSREHRDHVTKAVPRNEARWREFEAQAQESMEAQAFIEASQKGSFDQYLATYLAN
jgi:glutamate--cysteine ligase